MQLKRGWEMNNDDKHFTLQFTKCFLYTPFLIPITTLWGQGIIFILKLKGLKTHSLLKSIELVKGEALF